MGRISEGSEAKLVPHIPFLIVLIHLFTTPTIDIKCSFIIIYMDVRLLIEDRSIFPSHFPTMSVVFRIFPSHFLPCPWSSLNCLPVLTGIHLPFMSSLTFLTSPIAARNVAGHSAT